MDALNQDRESKIFDRKMAGEGERMQLRSMVDKDNVNN